ncbi:acetyl-CoA carboxylase biotin carboxyl carrier protein [Erwinia sp. AnSW2-5]|uniref:acetyl-CoA carboxylase biotin carboxyl carrier protein n=1 Tax=Erwinia sp. AnSW2-5 TaxID=3367692 RepID=UPI003859715E
MIAFRELQSLVNQMQRSGLTRLQINSADYAIRMICQPGSQLPAAPAPEPAAVAEVPVTPVAVTAPMPGRLWLQDPLSGKNVGPVSGPVEAGCLLALVQAGPLCLPVRAPQDGILTSIDATQGQAVEYAQPLMHLLPAGQQQTKEHDHAQHRS